jgi:hypothetical protein
LGSDGIVDLIQLHGVGQFELARRNDARPLCQERFSSTGQQNQAQEKDNRDAGCSTADYHPLSISKRTGWEKRG